MKISRILSIALALVLPLAFTGCDDGYYVSPEELIQGYWKTDFDTYEYVDYDGLVWKTETVSYSTELQFTLFDWGKIYTYEYIGSECAVYDEGNYYFSGNYLVMNGYDYYVEYVTDTDMKLTWEGYDTFGDYYYASRYMYKVSALPMP